MCFHLVWRSERAARVIPDTTCPLPYPPPWPAQHPQSSDLPEAGGPPQHGATGSAAYMFHQPWHRRSTHTSALQCITSSTLTWTQLSPTVHELPALWDDSKDLMGSRRQMPFLRGKELFPCTSGPGRSKQQAWGNPGQLASQGTGVHSSQGDA